MAESETKADDAGAVTFIPWMAGRVVGFLGWSAVIPVVTLRRLARPFAKIFYSVDWVISRESTRVSETILDDMVEVGINRIGRWMISRVLINFLSFLMEKLVDSRRYAV